MINAKFAHDESRSRAAPPSATGSCPRNSIRRHGRGLMWRLAVVVVSSSEYQKSLTREATIPLQGKDLLLTRGHESHAWRCPRNDVARIVMGFFVAFLLLPPMHSNKREVTLHSSVIQRAMVSSSLRTIASATDRSSRLSSTHSCGSSATGVTREGRGPLVPTLGSVFVSVHLKRVDRCAMGCVVIQSNYPPSTDPACH